MSKRRYSDERDYGRDHNRSYGRDSGRFDERGDRGFDSWKRRRSDSDCDPETLPKVFTVHRGEVAGIQAYGIFVKLPGVKKQGLVHKSQMSRGRVDDPSDMVQIGEKIYVKVISVETPRSGIKIGLSMKTVDQRKGSDMDPNNVELGDERRQKQWSRNGRGRIEIGAELNTTCRKCGGRGHMAHECYSQRDRGYDMVPDDDDDYDKDRRERRRDSADSADNNTASKKKKKEKKDKKHKKSKKKTSKKRHSDSSSSSDDEDSSGREKKKKKKEGSKSDASADGSQGRVRRYSDSSPGRVRQYSDSSQGPGRARQHSSSSSGSGSS